MAALPAPRCWILTDGKIGKINQCRGLAEALGYGDSAIAEKVIAPRFPWSILPPRWWLRPLAAGRGTPLTPPWPELIICCGRPAVAPAAAIRQRARGASVVVAVQEPKLPNASFDLIITAFHDRLGGAGVLQTTGAMNRIRETSLQQGRRDFAPAFANLPRPLVGIALGGANRRMKIHPERIEALVADCRKMLARGYGLVVTPSRRSPERLVAAMAQLAAEFGEDKIIVWNGLGANPYFGILALADYLLVTDDSVSMISEAATTGKPLYLLELSRGVGKFNQFADHLIRLNIARRFVGELEPPWHYEPLADTHTAALRVQELLAAKGFLVKPW